MAPTITTTLLGVGVEDVEVKHLDEGFVRVTLGVLRDGVACAELIDRSEVLRAVFARVLVGLIDVDGVEELDVDERALAQLVSADGGPHE